MPNGFSIRVYGNGNRRTKSANLGQDCVRSGKVNAAEEREAREVSLRLINRPTTYVET